MSARSTITPLPPLPSPSALWPASCRAHYATTQSSVTQTLRRRSAHLTQLLPAYRVPQGSPAHAYGIHLAPERDTSTPLACYSGSSVAPGTSFSFTIHPLIHVLSSVNDPYALRHAPHFPSTRLDAFPLPPLLYPCRAPHTVTIQCTSDAAPTQLPTSSSTLHSPSFALTSLGFMTPPPYSLLCPKIPCSIPGPPSKHRQLHTTPAHRLLTCPPVACRPPLRSRVPYRTHAPRLMLALVPPSALRMPFPSAFGPCMMHIRNPHASTGILIAPVNDVPNFSRQIPSIRCSQQLDAGTALDETHNLKKGSVGIHEEVAEGMCS
ncbi:hypothetical protein HYPSUDRAFT_201369 [Hypholoma sublateritium FD-334 SS-4]|uniref:Uncharacterized protein n=1 Tax=Hypholoma sublateritium (strain FD-334 SS-4) TaxID=945553 RepID=A0A0D2P3S9_HYPSF|nr:hypothetical protein HYPSUDRAFT_201369 [Hypholoma sublateritium FD-334 SS-4]